MTGAVRAAPARQTPWRPGGRAAALLLVPGAAQAHGSAPGLTGFVNGFIHPLVEPAHLVALIAFALLIGQRGIRASRPGLLCLCLATGAGLLAAGTGWAMNTDVAVLACAAVIGIVVAVARPVPGHAYALAGVSVGLGIGLASAPDGPGGSAALPAMLGTWAGTCVWGTNGSGLVEAMKRPWLQVLVRVIASWMTACAVLFLALSVAPAPVGSPAPGVAPGSLDVGR